MKFRFRAVTHFLAWTFLLSACQLNEAHKENRTMTPEKATILRLTEADASEERVLKNGQSFEIYLSSNPSTGYAWQATLDERQVIVQTAETNFIQVENSNGLVGRGGQQIFFLQAAKTGNASITFQYQRAWEKDIPAAQTLTYRFNVQ